MYEYPFGNEQQLNLNWIISEIISIHKALDPDYEAPTFDNAFPFMNLNVLNLDWIIRELKTIKDLAPTEDASLLKMVANALISETYDASKQYNVDDIIYRDEDNRLYICTTATPVGGETWTESHWQEMKVGDALTNLIVNAVTNVRYNNGKIEQEINGVYSDVIEIETEPTNVTNKLPSSKAVYDLKGAINGIYNAGTTTHNDCNNFIKGFVKVAPETANLPESCYGVLWGYVAQNESWKWQILETTQDPPKIFKRENINNGGWSNWVRIADDTDISSLNGAIMSLQNSQEYHKGDTFSIDGGMVLMAVIGTSGNTGGAIVNLPKEIGSDVTGYLWSGTINFWAEKDHPNGITGLTITGITKTSNSSLGISFSLPSGTSLTARTLGFINMMPTVITFN